MKSKSLAVFFTVLLFLIIPLSLFAQQQRDFYGTWVASYAEEDVSMIVKITFAASSYTMSMEMAIEGETFGVESFDGTITKWTAVTNSDDGTKSTYPNGFKIVANYEGETEELTMLMSRDRRQIILPELNVYDIEFIFRKQ